jgi:hypothetical protein
MTVEKISISLDSDLLEVAREEATVEGISLSAWLADAVRDRARLLGLRHLIDEYQAEFGPFTEDERASARHWLAEAQDDVRTRATHRET